mmetsp:Transcript_23982/g.43876  ORF Transcript_23982/g.43876 Transcript_23982/m.43876 type:complete len:188 (-) Transcript_23982:245-808(-)
MRQTGSPKLLWSLVNLITLSRLISGLGSIWLSQAPEASFLLGLLFLYIFLSDLADGHLARRWSVETKFGSLFDYVVDRFNIYVQIALLVAFDVPIWLFVPFLIRDMAYIFVQAYVHVDRVSGTKQLSLVSTVMTYIYVLLVVSSAAIGPWLMTVLFCSYLLSLGNFGLRVFRLRHHLRDELRNDFGG